MKRVRFDPKIPVVKADYVRQVEVAERPVEDVIEEMWNKEFGGQGSGNFGHAGRQGEVGGSASSGGGGFREVNAKDIVGSLTKNEGLGFAESRVVRDYTQFGYIRLNNALRRGTQGDVRADVRLMDRAMNQTTTRGIVVYRGIDSEVLDELRKKSGFVDKGFVSTTTDRKVPEGYYDAVVRIEIPRGIKCRWVGWGIGKDRSEKELILERGLRFKWVGGKNGMQDTLRVVKE